jgi:HK97 family phage prohead protease
MKKTGKPDPQITNLYSGAGVPAKPCFRAGVYAMASGAGVLEMLVYEQIGEDYWTGEGITAKACKDQIDQAGSAFSRIALRINSPGGDAFEGVAIMNMLRAQGKPIDVYVDGIAASAASIVAMAGDTITMGAGAMMMVHNAWSVVMGNSEDMAKEATTLTAIDIAIAQTYVDRTGQTAKVVQAMMAAETWMGADECVKNGFATAKAPAPADAGALAMARGFKALKKFGKTPEALTVEVEVEVDTEDEECECQCAACVAGAVASQSVSETNLIWIANIAARMGTLSHYDVEFPRGIAGSFMSGSVFCLRRVAGTTFNLAPASDGSAAVARVSGIVAPYGSASGDLGGFQEIYQNGCFDKWLGGDDPRVLAFHNPEHVLGRKSAGTARFWSDAKGLHYEADLPDTQVARDLRISMERGDVRESSAAFYITDYAWENRGGVRTRVIKEARLVEASPYSFPAYTESTATSKEAPQAAADHELEYIGARLGLLKYA